MAAPNTVIDAGAGISAPNRSRERSRRQLDDSRPRHRRRADLPCLSRVVTLQIHRQHDRQCVCNDRRDVVPIYVRCDVLASFPLSQTHRQPHQAQRANQESQVHNRATGESR